MAVVSLTSVMIPIQGGLKMGNLMFKHTLLGLALFAIGLCQLQSTNAQIPGQVMRGRPAASCSDCGPQEVPATTLENRSAKQAAHDNADTDSRSEKKKPGEIQLSLSTADIHNGIAGFVEDKLTGARINFESKRIGDQLISHIKNIDGYTIIEYTEMQRESVASDPGSPPSIEPVPSLRINGVDHKGYEGQIVNEMKVIASSEEGELIRHLAFYLIFHAPRGELEAERRGLEVPYQAIQRFYEQSYKKSQPGKNGRAQLEAISHSFANRSTNSKSTEPHDEFVLMPEGCKMPKCDYVDTHDYQLSEQGGFVVKSLPQRLSLSHNYASPQMVHEHDGEGLRPMDDGSQVGDCFGRCGSGCGDWTHEWISRTDYEYTTCREVQYPPDYLIDCTWFCCFEQRRVVTSQGIAVHIAHGRVTSGAIAHDACCRSHFLGCYNPECMALFPWAIAECTSSGVGWMESWSYVGPHTEYSDERTGCCDN
jgi:hypothetical protein